MKFLNRFGDQTLFLLSNMMFSGSTYIVMLGIPYMLNLEQMAQFSSMYNALVLLLFTFELGISLSFLRSYQIHHIYKFLYVNFQLLTLVILLFLFLTPLKYIFYYSFDLNKIDITFEIFLLAIIGQLSWIYIKNLLQSSKKFDRIFWLSFLILCVRIFGMLSLYLLGDITLNKVLLFVFVAPFSIIFILLSIYDTSIFVDELNRFNKNMYKKRLLKVLYFYLKKLLSFSSIIYLNGILYILAGRYLIIYLTKHDALILLANLGFASVFLGIITVLSASFKGFLVGTYHVGDQESIKKYLDQLFKKLMFYIGLSVIISLCISVIVYLIQPSYLDIKAPIFSFILLLSYSLLFLISLITFLSKTMNYNILELKLNIFRLVVTVILIHTFILDYPIGGFIAINAIMVLSEVWFARQVLKRMKYVK